jgi:parallel beta-helix repeat protein
LIKKILTIGIIILFLGVVINSSVAINNINKPISNGKTLYVGGTGPGNYTKIQDAINDANSGDTVFVYSGTYYENIVVYKSIDLIGENKNTTVIDGGGLYGFDVIYISFDRITISGFLIQNSGMSDAGIYIRSKYNNIIGNTISNNGDGVRLSSIHNTIMDNIITTNHDDGIEIWTHSNTIRGNIISNNNDGIHLKGGSTNTIIGNNIYSNKGIGILLMYTTSFGGSHPSHNNSIYKNNFFNNKQDAYFVHNIMNSIYRRNKWWGNYWNRPRILPKIISGKFSFFLWIYIDWRPAFKPYDIKV